MKGLLMYLLIWTVGYFYASNGSAAESGHSSSSLSQAVIKQDPPKLLFIDVHHIGRRQSEFRRCCQCACERSHC